MKIVQICVRSPCGPCMFKFETFGLALQREANIKKFEVGFAS